MVSAQYTATANPEAFGHLLTQYMEELAAQLSQEGGIIGHIKASVEVSHIEMYSITDTKVMKKSSRDTLLKLHLAAIVFAVSQDHAIDLVKMLFTRLESCLGDPL